MGFDLNDFIQKREDKGIHISYSVDIRVVEGLLKKVFGKKKDEDTDETEDKDNGGQNSDSR